MNTKPSKLKIISSFIFLLLTLHARAQQVCNFDNTNSSENTFDAQNSAIVVDSTFNLMWSRCSWGQSGINCEESSATPLTWTQALQLPEQLNNQNHLGFNDWRLPNIKELSTILDLRCSQPAIDLSIFPNTPQAEYWSSSPYVFYPHYAWFIDFNSGNIDYLDRTDDSFRHVRLVRSF